MGVTSLVLEVNLLLAVMGAALALMRSHAVPGRRTYAALAGAGALWCAGALLSERMELDAWFGQRLTMLGLVLVAPFWLGVAAQMAGLPVARRLPWFPAALAVPGALVWALLFFDPWSALVLRETGEPGPLWWIYTLFSYALVLLGCTVHVANGIRRESRVHRVQLVGIGLAGLVPLGTHAAHHWLDLGLRYDPTPFTLMPVGIALASSLFPGGLLDVRPIAQRNLIDHLPLGVVMADGSGAVFEVNPHAERALALAREDALGRALDALLAEAPPGYRVELSEVRVATRLVARFAFLYPPEMQRERGPAVASPGTTPWRTFPRAS
jgi:PAS domain-containing protein